MKRVTDKGYWMDGFLKSHLDSMCHDIKEGFDFVVLVTGDGETRGGKSTLSGQMAYYCAWKLGRPWGWDDAYNYVFSGAELIKVALKSEPTCFIYDEALAELNSRKANSLIQLNLTNFLSECGKLNHILFIVLPNFFDLTKSIATVRSECLINVSLRKKEKKLMDQGKEETILERKRGLFFFYAKTKKRYLYIKGKQFDDYNAIKSDFWGDFKDFWCVNREAYERKKDEFLNRVRTPTKVNKYKLQRDALIRILYNKAGFSGPKISDLIKEEGHKLGIKQVYNVISP